MTDNSKNTPNFAPKEWQDSLSPEVVIPEFSNFEFGSHIKPSAMSRHFLFLGETGSGKTKSGLWPALKGLIKFNEEDPNLRNSCLVIDPKHELSSLVLNEVIDKDRVVEISADNLKPRLKLDLFEDSNSQLTRLDQLDIVLGLIVPTLYNEAKGKTGGKDPFWAVSAYNNIKALVNLDHVLQTQFNVSLGQSLLETIQKFDDDYLLDIYEKEMSDAQLPENPKEADPESNPQYPMDKLIKAALTGKPVVSDETADAIMNAQGEIEFEIIHDPLLDHLSEDDKWADDPFSEDEDPFENDTPEFTSQADIILKLERKNSYHDIRQAIRKAMKRPGYFALFEELITCCLQSTMSSTSTPSKPKGNLAKLVDLIDNLLKAYSVENQVNNPMSIFTNIEESVASSIIVIMKAWLVDLANDELARSLVTFENTDGISKISIKDCVEAGKIIIYRPKINVSGNDVIVAKVLKKLFFKYTFVRQNKDRGVAYVCDEFQRFVTSDPESGEQSYLDRCRAFRGVCVLATQSISSILYEVLSKSGEHDKSSSEQAISVMLNNIGNKFFFRSTDIATLDLLKNLIPQPYGEVPHIINVRPPSTLSPGECYYLTAQGQWGRKQVKIAGL